MNEHLEIRKKIHKNGEKLYESCPEGAFQWLVGEIMALNENYVLYNQNSQKSQDILKNGFSISQRKWINAILKNKTI